MPSKVLLDDYISNTLIKAVPSTLLINYNGNGYSVPRKFILKKDRICIFLTPIKKNDIRIADNDMLTFEGRLEGIGGHVLYQRKRIKGGKYLYAFRDACKAATEDVGFIGGKSYEQARYEKKKMLFEVVVFESDPDLSPQTVYRCYDDRPPAARAGVQQI